MLIGKYSSSAHELLLQFLLGRARSLRVVRWIMLSVLRAASHEVLERRGDEPATGTLLSQGSGEGAPAKSELQAPAGGVQVRAPPG